MRPDASNPRVGITRYVRDCNPHDQERVNGLLGGVELYANGFGGRDDVADGIERAGGWIDLEDGEGVGILVGGDEEFAGGIDVEVARGFAAGAFVFDVGEFAVGSDGEGGDGVVAAVGAVNEFAGGMNEDLGGAVAGNGIAAGQSGDGLEFGEGAFGGIVVEAGDVAGHFVVHVGAFAVGAESEVARAAAGFDGGGGRFVGNEGAVGRSLPIPGRSDRP